MFRCALAADAAPQLSLRARDEDDMHQYEVGILRDIHKELQREKSIEAAKRARDAYALKQLALQNIENVKLMKIKKAGLCKI